MDAVRVRRVRPVRMGKSGRTVSLAHQAPISEEPGMLLRSRLVLATFLVVACAGCGGNAADPGPSATPDSTLTAPTSSEPPELAGYTQAERAAYASAVAAHTTYGEHTARFEAEGRTTGEAKDFYQHYAIDWSTSWGNLALLANNGVKITGTEVVRWTLPVTIDLSDETDVVVIRQCLDQTEVVVTQNGKVMPQPQHKQPHRFRIRLEKRPGENWWRSGIPKQGSAC